MRSPPARTGPRHILREVMPASDQALSCIVESSQPSAFQRKPGCDLRDNIEPTMHYKNLSCRILAVPPPRNVDANPPDRSTWSDIAHREGPASLARRATVCRGDYAVLASVGTYTVVMEPPSFRCPPRRSSLMAGKRLPRRAADRDDGGRLRDACLLKSWSGVPTIHERPADVCRTSQLPGSVLP